MAQIIDDLGDSCLGAAVLERIRAGKEQTHSLNDVMEILCWTLRMSETPKRQLKKLDRSTAHTLLRFLNRVLVEAEHPTQRGKLLTANLTGLRH